MRMFKSKKQFRAILPDLCFEVILNLVKRLGEIVDYNRFSTAQLITLGCFLDEAQAKEYFDEKIGGKLQVGDASVWISMGKASRHGKIGILVITSSSSKQADKLLARMARDYLILNGVKFQTKSVWNWLPFC